MEVRWRVLLVFQITLQLVCEETAAGTTVNIGFLYKDNPLEVLAVRHAIQTFNNTSMMQNTSFAMRETNLTSQDSLYLYTQSLLQQDVAVIIEGTSTSMSACAASTIAKIPLLRIHDNVNQLGGEAGSGYCQHSLALTPGYKAYAQATMAIIGVFQWTKIALVYEMHRFYEVAYFQSFSSGKELSLVFIDMRREDNQTSDEMLTITKKQISVSSAEVVLVFMNDYHVKLLLEKDCPCSSGQNQIWIINGAMPVNLRAQDTYAVVAFRLAVHNQSSTSNLVTSLDASDSQTELNFDNMRESVFLAADALCVAIHAVTNQIRDGKWTAGNSTSAIGDRGFILLEYLKKVNFKGVSGPIAFNDERQRTNIHLDVLNLRNNSFVKVGEWNSTNLPSKRLFLKDSIQVNNPGNGWDGKQLQGSKFRVVTVEDPPFIIKRTNAEGHVVYEGFTVNLLKDLAKQLKFTFEMYDSPDGSYGAKIGNEWTGMIRELLLKKADMAAAAITVTEEREKVVDFTVAFKYYTEEMLMKKDSVEETAMMQFMSPFSISVWLMLLVCLLIVTVAIYVLNYFSPYGWKNEKGLGTAPEFNLFNCLWFSLACMLQQGADNTPKSLAARILAAVYWFSILIWVATYTANLAAYFTVKNVAQQIDSLEEAIDSNNDIGVTMGTNLYSFFRDTEFQLYKKVWTRMKSRKSFPNNTLQGIGMVRRGNYIHIGDGPTLKYVAQKQPCDLITVSGLTTPKGMAFAVQDGDPRLDNLTLAILRLRESGHISNTKGQWWDATNNCPSEQGKAISQKRIQLDRMVGVYIVLGAGIVLAAIVLAAEILWKKRGHELAWKKSTTTRVNVQPCEADGNYNLAMADINLNEKY